MGWIKEGMGGMDVVEWEWGGMGYEMRATIVVRLQDRQKKHE